MNKVKIAVLMATYNGMPWLEEQIDSILSQKNVSVRIFVSDDLSNDNTNIGFLKEISKNDTRITLFSTNRKFGSAGRNFYNLIQNVDITGFDFIAFADQDDIWESYKLIRHVQIARHHDADGVSSNVLAFWPDGKRKLIIKSQPQKKWDFLFESAGPGCTFLMTTRLVNKIREQLVSEQSPAKRIILHDWLTYAICRAHGHKWVIDSMPSVLYRQHQSNVIGANSGLKAKLARLKKLKQSWYRSEIIKICHVCVLISGDTEVKKIGSLLTNRNITSQIKLLVYVAQARRKFLDRLALFFLILTFLF